VTVIPSSQLPSPRKGLGKRISHQCDGHDGLLRVYSKWVLAVGHKAVREVVERLNEYEEPVVVDHLAFAGAFGDTAMLLKGALRNTLRWYRERLAGK
jgi:hypothetical protein